MLLDWATSLAYGTTRALQKKPITKSSYTTRKRRRMSTKKPKLPPERFEGHRDEHVATIGEKRSICKYCSYVKLMWCITSPTATATASNVYRKCSKRDVHLCASHFNVYHEEEDNYMIQCHVVQNSVETYGPFIDPVRINKDPRLRDSQLRIHV